MVLREGEKVLVLTRRLFDGDVRRHFVGEVTAATEHLIRVEGYAFICDLNSGKYTKMPEKRSRIFSIVDSGIIVYVLAETANLEQVRYAVGANRRLIVTDGEAVNLDITEFKPD